MTRQSDPADVIGYLLLALVILLVATGLTILYRMT